MKVQQALKNRMECRRQRPGLRETQVRSCPQNGFSLIEVIIATAILMGSAVVLSRLAGMGREQSQKASIHAEAQQLCELTLHELLLGLRVPEPVEAAPLLPLPTVPQEPADLQEQAASEWPLPDTDPATLSGETDARWRHSIVMELLPDLPGMWRLTVVVVQADEQLTRPVRYSLTRWIPGPPPAGAFDDLDSQGVDAESSPVTPESMSGGGPQ